VLDNFCATPLKTQIMRYVLMIDIKKEYILLNSIISTFLGSWFRISEPFMLLLARQKSKGKVESDLVSIIIATYNRSNILVGRTLPSILAQTHKNIEVVIIGDKCIDDTAERLKILNDPRIIFYDLPKRGVYPQDIKDKWFVQGSVPRNEGMKLAKGHWFVFISDDDVMYENHIEKLIKAAVENDLEFVSASYRTVKDGKDLIVHPEKNNIGSDLICGGMQTWLYKSYLRSFKWNRHSWRKTFDRPVDYDLQQRFYRAGVKMDNIREVVFYNPPVEGTNTTGYQAALEADKL
jgi:glycosyltransferase involved in cell wall biosynthesis